MLIKNRAATKNRNKMWNLACVSGSCFFRKETVNRSVSLVSHERNYFLSSCLVSLTTWLHFWIIHYFLSILFLEHNILLHSWTEWQEPLSYAKQHAEEEPLVTWHHSDTFVSQLVDMLRCRLVADQMLNHSLTASLLFHFCFLKIQVGASLFIFILNGKFNR